MPCNSGVSLIPVIDGQYTEFAARGLYNGLALLGDKPTNSYWDHITGECVLGHHKGKNLEYSDHDLLYTTVEAALKMYPDAQLAQSSKLDLRGKFLNFVTPFMHRFMGNNLPPHFVKTVGEADTRRETMDLGLGVWTTAVRRYYPMDAIKAHPKGIFDRIEDETLFIYYDDIAKAPDAFFIEAQSVELQVDNSYRFDTGVTLVNGFLYDGNGEKLAVKRPQQMFTRWYGFSYTFPNCDIYDGQLIPS